MPRSDTLRSELARLVEQAAGIQKDLGRFEAAVPAARAAAGKERCDAAKTSSDSARRSALSAAEREDRKAVDAQSRIAAMSVELAANQRSQASKRQSLGSAERAERRGEERAAGQRRRQEVSHARELARLARLTVQLVSVAEPVPKRLRVLYLTADAVPGVLEVAGPDGEPQFVSGALRLQLEVQAAVQAAAYRDRVTVHWRPAASPESFVAALNELRPHLVHFSGHGWSDGVVLDDGDVAAPGKAPVAFAQLARLLAATDAPPLVLVLNACGTAWGAEQLLEVVPVVVAMDEQIGDTDAVLFARSFYAAIAAVQPVGVAFEQAASLLELVSVGAPVAVPRVLVRDGIDLAEVRLIDPDWTVGGPAARLAG